MLDRLIRILRRRPPHHTLIRSGPAPQDLADELRDALDAEPPRSFLDAGKQAFGQAEKRDNWGPR